MIKKRSVGVTHLLLLIYIALVVLVIHPYIGGYNVDKDVKAILFDHNGFGKTIRLRINGALKNNLLHSSVFTGEFQVEGFEFSFDNEYTVLLHLGKSKQSDLLSGSLAYTRFPGMDQKSIGRLYTDRRMNILIIQLYNRDAFTYVVAADNVNDAKAIVHRHLNDGL